jgi:serine/threonine protein kinase/tetratricopeptide (TPR) repeat protein
MSLTDLPARELARIDGVCMDFERQIRAGESPDIEDWVRRFGGEQAELLRSELKLVAAELANIDLTQATRELTIRGTSNVDAINQVAAIRAATPGTVDGSPSEYSLIVGERLGPYRILRPIGRGGMGEVYCGRDERLDRDVAIKVLLADLARNPQRSERFDREARAVANLAHPNVVNLFDVGNHRGRPYAVMELLAGKTLREHLQLHSPLTAVETRRIGVAAAEALAAAHAASIIHRDLKPENLFLTTDGNVKLLDFGLSRSHSTDDTHSPTDTGVILGTIGYLSPEQANGEKVTPAADIFSLGCVLHECFYGRRAFAGGTVAESLAAIINVKPIADPQQAASDPQLAEIISRCMEKEPEKRFPTAASLAQSLRGSPTLPSTPTTTPASTTRQLSRRRLLANMAIGGTLASGAAGFLFYRYQRRYQIRSVAVLPLQDNGPVGSLVPGMSLRDLGLGEELSAAIADQLTRVSDLRVVPYLPLRSAGMMAADLETAAKQLAAGAITPDAVSRVAKFLGVDAILIGSVTSDGEGFQTIHALLIEARSGSQIGKHSIRVRESSNLIGQQRTALLLAEGIGTELNNYRTGSVADNGCYHCLVNGYSRMDADSPPALRDALQCFENAVRQDEKFPEAFAGMSITAMLLLSQVDYEERVKLQEVARSSADSALALEPESGGAVLAKAMLAWLVDWQFPRAAELFAQCMPRLRDSWVAQHEYALFLLACGAFESAREYAERAVSLDPVSVAFRIDRSRAIWFAGDASTALNELRALLATTEKQPQQLVVGAMLDILEATNRLDEAIELLSRYSTGLPDEVSRENYWSLRESSLSELPYGTYDSELNHLHWELRAGQDLSEERLQVLKVRRPPKLPLLVSSHPTFAPLKSRSTLQELVLATSLIA